MIRQPQQQKQQNIQKKLQKNQQLHKNEEKKMNKKEDGGVVIIIIIVLILFKKIIKSNENDEKNMMMNEKNYERGDEIMKSGGEMMIEDHQYFGDCYHFSMNNKIFDEKDEFENNNIEKYYEDGVAVLMMFEEQIQS